MIWLVIALLAAAALLPAAAALLSPPPLRDRQAADLALYQAQLAELAREHAAGRLDDAALAAARLEVQRRLLAAPAAPPVATGGAGWRLWAPLGLVAPLAIGLYWFTGQPDMPSATFVERQEIARRDDDVLAQLRARIAQLPADGEQARQGWVLLGSAERTRGNIAASADAYRHALAIRFEAELAAQLAQVLLEDGQNEAAAQFLAEALPQAPDHVGLRFLTGLAQAQAGHPEAARTAWQALVDAAPPEAPWRAMVQRRMEALP